MNVGENAEGMGAGVEVDDDDEEEEDDFPEVDETELLDELMEGMTIEDDGQA
ncbi:hypothetical protein HK405_000427, partial [Cladochytrium tenue]